jgi:hypothetical protein
MALASAYEVDRAQVAEHAVNTSLYARRRLAALRPCATPLRYAPALRPCATQSCSACVPAKAIHGLGVRCSIAAHPAPLAYQPKPSMAWTFAARSQLTLLRLRTSPSLPWLERSLLDAVHPATLARPALTVRGEGVRRLRRLTHAADGFADLPPPPPYEVSAEGWG